MNAFAIRLSDLILSSIFLLLLSVPMLIVAALIWFEDRGPALFKQNRIGRNGAHFSILKFRTMYVEQGRSQGNVKNMSPADMLAARKEFKTTQVADPRITRMGKILRSSHIDELPQFLNVLMGDMSIVGVRPDTPIQQVDYTDDVWIRRHFLRPGITGLAQLNTSTQTPEARISNDLKWVENPTFGIYWRTILSTIKKVLKRTGN